MKKIIIGIIIVALLVIGGYFLFKNVSRKPESNSSKVQVELKTGTKNEVIYTDSGYSPVQLTIKVGETVTFKNKSSGGMWTAAGMHPSHTIYSDTSLQEHCPDTTNTSFDECTSAQPGQSWSFTFNKKGTWAYHNHVQAFHFGKIIVE